MATAALFDLAVNRALSYALRTGALGRASFAGPPDDPSGVPARSGAAAHPGPGTTDPATRPAHAALHAALEVWYLKTRFAYRVPLDSVIAVLRTWPGEPQRWQGGESGGWRPGPPPTP